MHPSFAWPLWSEGWHELQDRCFSSLLMHRWIRLGGFCGPIAVIRSQGMRDVNCWAVFFNEQFPWWLWCLESRVKLVYHRLRIGWLRNKLADEFFPCNWWLARILLKNGLLSAEAPSFHLGFCKILPSRPGHCVFLFLCDFFDFLLGGPISSQPRVRLCWSVIRV